MSVLFLPPPSASAIPDASETVSGKIRIATSAEATAGTNDLTAMTPLKVKSVVDAAVVGGVTYQGTFDAAAPLDLSNAEQGDLYVINGAGTYQGQSWAVGDHLLVNADMGGTVSPSKIDKIDSTDSVTSVAGRTGAVTLSTADISGLATVATTGAYSDLSGTPTLATVATTGAYSDLSGTPTLATVATTGAYSDLSGTPTLGTAAALDVGTSATNVVQLDGSARLPAVDGSQLTGITASVAALDDIGDVTITSVQDYAVLKYDSGTTEWIDAPQINYVFTSTTQSLDLKPGVNRVIMAGGASAITLTLGISTLVAGQGAVFTVLSTGTATSTLTIGSTSWTFDQHQGGVFVATGLNTAYMVSTISYDQLENLPTLGTAAALDVGTSATNVVQLDGSARLPAVDGSQLTGITASVAALNDIGDVSAATPSNTNVIKYNSTSGDWESGAVAYSEVTGTPTLATVATTGAYSDLTGTPTLATVATTGAYSDLSGTPTLGTAAALDVGTSANNVVQLNGSAQLPAVDGSLLTGVTASASPPSVTVSSPAADQTLTGPSGTEEIYIYTPSTAIAVNLVAAATCGSGFRYRIKNMSATNNITVTPASGTIDGASTYVLSVQYSAVTLTTDGTNWYIL